MNADRLGLLSALMASVCCVTPLLLVLLGLGGLGIGAVLGRFHWGFLLAAIGLLTYGWRVYVQEQRRCRTAQCEMPRSHTTRAVLVGASVIVTVFIGLNLYTHASQRFATPPPASHGPANIVLPVEGMTCLTCELTIESGLKRLRGVSQADARVAAQAVFVSYDPGRVGPADLITAINTMGYRASRPTDQ